MCKKLPLKLACVAMDAMLTYENLAITKEIKGGQTRIVFGFDNVQEFSFVFESKGAIRQLVKATITFCNGRHPTIEACLFLQANGCDTRSLFEGLKADGKLVVNVYHEDGVGFDERAALIPDISRSSKDLGSIIRKILDAKGDLGAIDFIALVSKIISQTNQFQGPGFDEVGVSGPVVSVSIGQGPFVIGPTTQL